VRADVLFHAKKYTVVLNSVENVFRTGFTACFQTGFPKLEISPRFGLSSCSHCSVRVK
jgi:hypothetical protein